MPSEKPNILLILSDQHTPGVTGCYGNREVRTPNINALAAEGVTFDSAYCASPLCVPSRLSMLSGRFPHSIRVWSLADTIASTTPTWPLPLSIAGWRTVLCGRMHLVWPDRVHGFENRLCGDGYPTIRNHFAHWRDPEPEIADSASTIRDAGVGSSRHDAEDDIATGHALKFLHEWKGSEGNRPFALCVGYYRPHTPFLAPPDLAALYENLDPELPDPLEDLPPFYRSLARHFGLETSPPTPEQARRAVRRYYSMVTGIDRRVGALCDALKTRGLWDNTIVIYTSDHGESLGRHGLWFKGNFFEESARVPLIVRFPKRFRAGIRIADPVSLLDLFPTFCDFAGEPPYDFLDGKSLLAALTEGQADPDRAVFSEFCDYGIHTPTRMIRKGKWKLIFAAGYEPLLFDLEADPREKANLAGRAEHKSVVESLLEQLLRGWDPETIRDRVLENQRNRDLFMAAEDSIKKAAGKEGFPWG
ncbi:MAG: Choline-sulfatase [bacterium]|nr:Choline-sulfatase [bacterium]